MPGHKRRRENSESEDDIGDDVSDLSSLSPSQESVRVKKRPREDNSTSPRPDNDGSSHSRESTPSSEHQELFEVSQILARSIYTANSEHYYLVRWEGFGPEEDSWEPKSNLMPDAGELVEAFDSEDYPFTCLEYHLIPPSTLFKHHTEHPFTILASRQHPAPRTYKVRYGLVTLFTPPSPLFAVEWHTPSQMKAKLGISIDSITDCLTAGVKGRRRLDGPLVAGNGRGKDAMSWVKYVKKSEVLGERDANVVKVRPTLIDILNVHRRKAKTTAISKKETIYYQVRSRYKNDIKEEWLSRHSVLARFGKESLEYFENGGKENQDMEAEKVEVNEYEAERLRNIEENKALMANLGLAL